MVQMIAASVGRLGGVNHPSDVKAVQELLNRVPHAAGGPYPLLPEDSVCGPSTVDAIQKFQLEQLGWSNADGRVDPSGPTMLKLAQLSGGRKPCQPRVLTTQTGLCCSHGGVVRVTLQGTPSPEVNGGTALRPSDRFAVTGCPLPTPCAWVNWVVASDPLNDSNIGICMSAAGAPLGKVRVR